MSKKSSIDWKSTKEGSLVETFTFVEQKPDLGFFGTLLVQFVAQTYSTELLTDLTLKDINLKFIRQKLTLKFQLQNGILGFFNFKTPSGAR